MGHVLGSLPGRAPDHLAVALEHDPGDLLEPPVVEVLHDRDDRLLALAHGDEIELVDERVRLARRIRAPDHCQRLAAHLRRQREGLVLHGDHAVDADDRRPEAVDLGQYLVPLEERMVDVPHGVAGRAKRRAEIHEAKGRHDPVPPLPRCTLWVDEHNVGSFHLSGLLDGDAIARAVE